MCLNEHRRGSWCVCVRARNGTRGEANRGTWGGGAVDPPVLGSTRAVAPVRREHLKRPPPSVPTTKRLLSSWLNDRQVPG